MAALAVTPAPVNGGASISDALVAATALGDTAPCGPGRFLVMKNGDAAPHTATVATPGTVAGLDVANAALAVAAGETAVLPLTQVFAGAGGRASITYDAVTSVTVAVIELGT